MVSSVLCQRTTVTRGLLCPSHAVRKLFAASNLALASWGLCAFVHRSCLPHTQSSSPVHRYLGLVILHASLLISVHWGLPRKSTLDPSVSVKLDSQRRTLPPRVCGNLAAVNPCISQSTRSSQRVLSLLSREIRIIIMCKNWLRHWLGLSEVCIPFLHQYCKSLAGSFWPVAPSITVLYL